METKESIASQAIRRITIDKMSLINGAIIHMLDEFLKAEGVEDGWKNRRFEQVEAARTMAVTNSSYFEDLHEA